MKKRVLSILLSIAMLMTIVPSIVTAAAITNAQYTIVLKDGKAYLNSVSTNNDMSTFFAENGLSYADGVWTMNNFSFQTTAAKAIYTEEAINIKLVGNNVLKSGDSNDKNNYPVALLVIPKIYQNATTTITGTGTLTATGGKMTADYNSEGIHIMPNTVIGGDVVINAISSDATAQQSYSFGFITNGSLTVKDNAVLNGKAGNGTNASSGAVVLGNVNAIAKVTDSDTELTFDQSKSGFKDSLNNVAKNVTLTSATSLSINDEDKWVKKDSPLTISGTFKNNEGTGLKSVKISGVGEEAVVATTSSAGDNLYNWSYTFPSSTVAMDKTLTVTATANNDATTVATYTAKIDGLAPEITNEEILPDLVTPTDSVSFKLTINDTASGIDEAKTMVQLGDGVKQAYTSGTTYTVENNGKVTFYLCDKVGNEATKVYEVNNISVAQIDSTKYLKLQDAINAATDGKTITLIKNTCENVTVDEGKNITIDINGKTLTSADENGTIITNNGTLTLTDTAPTSGAIKGGAKGVLQNGALTVGGRLTIYGSTANVYLPNGKKINIESLFNGSIGITTEATPADNELISFLTDSCIGSVNYSSYFRSDNENFKVITTGTKEAIELKLGTAYVTNNMGLCFTDLATALLFLSDTIIIPYYSSVTLTEPMTFNNLELLYYRDTLSTLNIDYKNLLTIKNNLSNYGKIVVDMTDATENEYKLIDANQSMTLLSYGKLYFKDNPNYYFDVRDNDLYAVMGKRPEMVAANNQWEGMEAGTELTLLTGSYVYGTSAFSDVQTAIDTTAKDIIVAGDSANSYGNVDFSTAKSRDLTIYSDGNLVKFGSFNPVQCFIDNIKIADDSNVEAELLQIWSNNTLTIGKNSKVHITSSNSSNQSFISNGVLKLEEGSELILDHGLWTNGSIYIDSAKLTTCDNDTTAKFDRLSRLILRNGKFIQKGINAINKSLYIYMDCDSCYSITDNLNDKQQFYVDMSNATEERYKLIDYIGSGTPSYNLNKFSFSDFDDEAEVIEQKKGYGYSFEIIDNDVYAVRTVYVNNNWNSQDDIKELVFGTGAFNSIDSALTVIKENAITDETTSAVITLYGSATSYGDFTIGEDISPLENIIFKTTNDDDPSVTIGTLTIKDGKTVTLPDNKINGKIVVEADSVLSLEGARLDNEIECDGILKWNLTEAATEVDWSKLTGDATLTVSVNPEAEVGDTYSLANNASDATGSLILTGISGENDKIITINNSKVSYGGYDYELDTEDGYLVLKVVSVTKKSSNGGSGISKKTTTTTASGSSSAESKTDTTAKDSKTESTDTDSTDTDSNDATSDSKSAFSDIKASDYFYDAVLWAVDKGITSGTGDSSFSPQNVTTRAQMVTFLWRLAGSPEATLSDTKFTDAKADAYYYKAMLWAVENGITAGTSETTFSPDMNVTRGQTVTFLARYSKDSATGTANAFEDVASGAYYYDSVLWAVEKGITSGTGDATFSPNADCTRAQIVTFLYRYAK